VVSGGCDRAASFGIATTSTNVQRGIASRRRLAARGGPFAHARSPMTVAVVVSLIDLRLLSELLVTEPYSDNSFIKNELL
jgi:hypothetical protein